MPALYPIPRQRLAALIGAVLLYGCASSGAEQSATPQPDANPLASMLSRQVVVFPAQLLSTSGPGGTWEVRPEAAPLLQVLDEEITDAFRKRGVRGNWTFAREITASANRNAGLAGNPLGLSVTGIRRVRAGDAPLPEPLAGQIRTLVSLTSARYAIMPLETRLDITADYRKGSLRLLLIDARTARVLYAGDVEGQASYDREIVRDAVSPYGFRILSRELAGLFADMVVPQ